MYCENCGKEIEEGMQFCKRCGAAVPDNSSIGAQNASFDSQGGMQQSPAGPLKTLDSARAIKMLVFGIVSLALGRVGGIVFGSITKHMAQDAINEGYVLEGKAKVGHILAQVGFIVGIVTAILAVVAIIWYIIYFSFVVYNAHSFMDAFSYHFY